MADLKSGAYVEQAIDGEAKKALVLAMGPELQSFLEIRNKIFVFQYGMLL